MDFMTYITEKALVLIPALLIIGRMLKTIPKFPDWLIPWALLIVSVTSSGYMLGFTVDSVIQGVLVAGAAVYGNQLWKQTKENRVADNHAARMNDE